MKKLFPLGLLIALFFLSCKKENNRPSNGTRLVKLVQGNNPATDTVCNFTYNIDGQVTQVSRINLEESDNSLYSLHYNSLGQIDSLYPATGEPSYFTTKGFSYNADGTLSEIRINETFTGSQTRYVFYYNNGIVLGAECYVSDPANFEHLIDYNVYTLENGNIKQVDFYDANDNLTGRITLTYSTVSNSLKLISLLDDFGPTTGMGAMTGLNYEGFFNRNLVAGYNLNSFSPGGSDDTVTLNYSFNSTGQLPVKIETKNLSNEVEETWHLTYE